MKHETIQTLVVRSLAVAMLLGLAGCSGMSARDKNTAVGAGVGAVGGAILTGGSAVGTVGGAAVGGVIGNQVGK
ncbi:MAG: glycine zipper 2TM domain-containing protein [Rugosibacter sp.]